MLKRNFIYKFWRLFLFLLIFSFAFSSVAPVIAAPEAEPPTNQQKAPPLSDYALEGFAPNKDDVNLSYLNALTGDIGGFHFFSENENPSVTKMFQIFNTGIVAVAAIVFMWNLLSAAVNSAHDGEFLGKRYNSFWTPTRAAFGIIFIMPVMAGWSPAQTAMAWAAWGGTGIANKIVANSDIGEAVARSASGMAGGISENGQAEAEKIQDALLCLFDHDSKKLTDIEAVGGVENADEALTSQIWTVTSNSTSDSFTLSFGNANGDNTYCGVIHKQLPILSNFANSEFPAIKEMRDNFMPNYINLYVTMLLKIKQAITDNVEILNKDKNKKAEFKEAVVAATKEAGAEFKLNLENLNDSLRFIQNQSIYSQIVNSANNYVGGTNGVSWVSYGFNSIPGFVASLTSIKSTQVVDKSNPPKGRVDPSISISDVVLSPEAEKRTTEKAIQTITNTQNNDNDFFGNLANLVDKGSEWLEKGKNFISELNLINRLKAVGEFSTNLFNNISNNPNAAKNDINSFTDELAKKIGISDFPMYISTQAQKLSLEYGDKPLAALQSLGIFILQSIGKIGHVLIIMFPIALLGGIALKATLGATSYLIGGTSSIPIIGGLGSTLANFVSWVGGKVEVLSSFYYAICFIFFAVAIPLVVFGIKMMILVPFTPTLMWIAGLATYFVIFIESLFGAQLWAMAHLLTSDGEGMGERTRHGYLFILNLFFRPAIMVITLYFAYQLVNLLGGIGTNVIVTALSTSINGIGEVGLFDTNFFMAIFIILGLIMIWLALMENLIHMCFSLIFVIPNQVFTWIGGQFGSQLGQDIGKSVSGQAGGGLQQVVNQISPHNISIYGQKLTAPFKENDRNPINKMAGYLNKDKK